MGAARQSVEVDVRMFRTSEKLKAEVAAKCQSFVTAQVIEQLTIAIDQHHPPGRPPAAVAELDHIRRRILSKSTPSDAQQDTDICGLSLDYWALILSHLVFHKAVPPTCKLLRRASSEDSFRWKADVDKVENFQWAPLSDEVPGSAQLTGAASIDQVHYSEWNKGQRGDGTFIGQVQARHDDPDGPSPSEAEYEGTTLAWQQPKQESSLSIAFHAMFSKVDCEVQQEWALQYFQQMAHTRNQKRAMCGGACGQRTGTHHIACPCICVVLCGGCRCPRDGLLSACCHRADNRYR